MPKRRVFVIAPVDPPVNDQRCSDPKLRRCYRSSQVARLESEDSLQLVQFAKTNALQDSDGALQSSLSSMQTTESNSSRWTAASDLERTETSVPPRLPRRIPSVIRATSSGGDDESNMNQGTGRYQSAPAQGYRRGAMLCSTVLPESGMHVGDDFLTFEDEEWQDLKGDDGHQLQGTLPP